MGTNDRRLRLQKEDPSPMPIEKEPVIRLLERLAVLERARGIMFVALKRAQDHAIKKGDMKLKTMVEKVLSEVAD